MMEKLTMLLLLVFVCPAWSKPSFKTNAGPLSPNENERNKLLPPPTWQGALTSSSTVYRVFLKQDAWEPSILIWQTALSVDSSDLFIFSIVSPLEKTLRFSLINPNGKVMNTKRLRMEGTVPFGHTHFISSSYTLKSPIPGIYRILFNVSAELAPKVGNGSNPNAILICYNKSPYRIHSYLSSYNLYVGSRVGIIARLYTPKTNSLNVIPNPISRQIDIVSSVSVTILFPSGKKKEYFLSDNASHKEDEKQGDNIFGGGFKLSENGEHVAQVMFRGITPEGNEYTRSTQHVFHVLQNPIKVVPSARSTLEQGKLNVEIEVNGDSTRLHRIYAEVWSYVNESISPIFWVSTIVNIQKTKTNSFYYVQLSLESKWIPKNDMLVLRNVYLQDIETFTPTDLCPQIILHETKSLFIDSSEKGVTDVVTNVSPLLFNNQSNTLVIIPDQYAERNPFKINSDKFPKKTKFHRSSKVCHTIHSYAEAIAKSYEKIEKYSVIAHAFGGLAAVHMSNYYFTGLDFSDEHITTISSAFKGSSAAGTIAMIGQAYQIQCQFSSLSIDVANLWLVGISDKTRRMVTTYSSQVTSSSVTEACCLSLSLLLDSPNDGIVEASRALLPGANNSSHIFEGWCHSWNMKQPALFSESSFISKLV